MFKVANLKELSALNGFIAAIEFSDEGKLLQKHGQIDDTRGNMVADLCSANKRMGSMQAHGLSTFSDLKGLDEMNGFTISGPALSLCVYNSVSLFVENSQCDFNEVYRLLKKL